MERHRLFRFLMPCMAGALKNEQISIKNERFLLNKLYFFGIMLKLRPAGGFGKNSEFQQFARAKIDSADSKI